jgi:hypothetical protein
LLARRWREGRRARGLEERAPFVWDRPELVGLDELEELFDAAIYRRERYRAWYGDTEAAWPAAARDRLQHAHSEIEALRAELRLGPQGAPDVPLDLDPEESRDLLEWRWRWREERTPGVRDRRGRIEVEGAEELLMIALDRRSRFVAVYGSDESVWPAGAAERLAQGRAEIEAMRAKLQRSET